MRFALCLGPSEQESTLLVRRMLAALPGRAGRARVFGFAGGALGVLTREGRDAELEERVIVGNSRVTIVACDPIGMSESVRTVLHRAHHSDNPGAELTNLDGAFVAVHLNAATGRHCVVTDFIGMAPAFQARRDGALLVCTTPSALLVDPQVPDDPDAAGWGALLGLGNMLRDQTKLAAVRRLPPAAVLQLDSRGTLLGERTYWTWPHEPAQRRLGAAEALELLSGSAAAYLRECSTNTVLFSGGFDSRVIAGLLQRAGASPRAVIQRHPDENANADGRFGVLAAKSMGLEYELHDVDRNFFSSPDYLAYLHEVDVDVPSLYLFISTTARLLKPSRGTVWLDTVLGTLVKRNAVASTTEEYARRVMHADQLPARLEGLRVFTRDWRMAMLDGAQSLLSAQMAEIPSTPQGAREMRNRTRIRPRIGAHFYRVHSGRVPVATPGLDRNSWMLTVGLPLEPAAARAELAKLLRDYMPRAARVPFASGVKLSRVTLAAAPQLWLQELMAGGQNAMRRRPFRRVASALGMRPFDWEPSHFLRNLDERLLSDSKLVDADAVAGARTAEEDAALFYWSEYSAIVARAREALPREAELLSLEAEGTPAGV